MGTLRKRRYTKKRGQKRRYTKKRGQKRRDTKKRRHKRRRTKKRMHGGASLLETLKYKYMSSRQNVGMSKDPKTDFERNVLAATLEENEIEIIDFFKWLAKEPTIQEKIMTSSGDDITLTLEELINYAIKFHELQHVSPVPLVPSTMMDVINEKQYSNFQLLNSNAETGNNPKFLNNSALRHIPDDTRTILFDNYSIWLSEMNKEAKEEAASSQKGYV